MTHSLLHYRRLRVSGTDHLIHRIRAPELRGNCGPWRSVGANLTHLVGGSSSWSDGEFTATARRNGGRWGTVKSVAAERPNQRERSATSAVLEPQDAVRIFAGRYLPRVALRRNEARDRHVLIGFDCWVRSSPLNRTCPLSLLPSAAPPVSAVVCRTTALSLAVGLSLPQTPSNLGVPLDNLNLNSNVTLINLSSDEMVVPLSPPHAVHTAPDLCHHLSPPPSLTPPPPLGRPMVEAD
jgi:hypothetical protein